MLRISKMADYGTLVMVYLARQPQLAQNARDIAQHTHLALPTVSKLLKLLARAGLLSSQRGVKGGYSLSRATDQISVADIIQAMDGNVALTQCSQHQGHCALEPICDTRQPWQMISRTVYEALAGLRLAEMVQPRPLNNEFKITVN